jgi:hypothetical protein
MCLDQIMCLQLLKGGVPKGGSARVVVWHKVFAIGLHH